MDLTPDPDQRDLRETLRRALAGAAPGDRREVWAQLGTMGLLDADALEPLTVLVAAEELGRTLVRVPYVETVEARTNGAPGDGLIVLAHRVPRAPAGPTAYGVTAAGDRLSGTKEPVPYAAWADAFVVTADTGLFLVAADAPGLRVTPYDTHDHAGAGRLDLDEVPATPLGRERVDLTAGGAARCAEAIGAMDVALAATCEHLRTRQQFGVALRSFQSLTHRAADMYVELENARSAVAWAALALHHDPLAVSRAVVQVGRASRFVGQNAIQLHGGIGITDEHPIGHHVSRLEALLQGTGGLDHHLGRLADALDLDAPVELIA